MQRKPQQINNSDLIELIKIAETKSEEEVILLEDDLFSFLRTFNIKNGDNLVLKSVIYELYKRWSKEQLNKIAFGLKLRSYLQDHKIGPKTYCKVNLDTIELNKYLILHIQKSKINKTKYISWKKHFEDFLKRYEIKPGRRWVQAAILKHLYNKWCYECNRKSLLSEKQLHSFLRLYFDYKRNGISRMDWFAVNEMFIKTYVTEHMLKTMQQKKRKSHEKKQKTKRKIPSTSPRTKLKNSL